MLSFRFGPCSLQYSDIRFFLKRGLSPFAQSQAFWFLDYSTRSKAIVSRVVSLKRDSFDRETKFRYSSTSVSLFSLRTVPLQCRSRSSVSRSHGLRITCNAASPGAQPAEDPYQVLGVRPLDSFDAIKMAHRKKLRDAEGKGDEAEIERIDRAYDAIMMRQLTMRKQGVTFGSLEVSKDIKFADQTDFLPWRPRYEKADNKSILINAAVSAVMAVWMVGAQSTDWKILQFLLSFYIFQLFMKLDPFYPQNTEEGEKRWQRNGRRLTRAMGLVFGVIALASLVHTLVIKAYSLAGMYVPRALYTFQETRSSLYPNAAERLHATHNLPQGASLSALRQFLGALWAAESPRFSPKAPPCCGRAGGILPLLLPRAVGVICCCAHPPLSSASIFPNYLWRSDPISPNFGGSVAPYLIRPRLVPLALYFPSSTLVREGNHGGGIRARTGEPMAARASTTSPTRDGAQEPRVTCEAIESCLKLSKDQARLVLDTLASVLPTGSEDIDSLSDASPSDAAKIGTDVDLLLLFLFLQRYRRVPNRSSRDAAVLADVWPQGPSPFDSVSPTATSALQIKTSLATRQRFQTGHAEEEQQQLSFLQKNLPAILQLLAEHGSDAAGGSGDGTEPGTQVISIDKFELLGLFLRVNRPGVPSLLLSQVAPFFAEADAAMPPAPVPLSVAQDWLGPRLCCTSDHGPDLRPQSPSRPAKVPADRGGDSAASPTKSGDTPMGEGGAAGGSGGGAGGEVQISPRGAAANGAMTGGVLSRRVWAAAGMTTVDGVAKMSVLKGETEVDSSCVRVAHCHDSVIYVLAPLKYASVIGCSDSIVVLGAVGKVVRVEACERLTLIAPCARIRIANCRECVFYLGCNSRPVILGDNHSLQIAPYNTFYPRLDYHLAKVGVDPAVNKWDMPLALGSLDAAAAAGAAGAGTAAGAAGGTGGGEAEGEKEGGAAAALDSAILMPPEKFVPFVVPFRTQQEQPGGGGASPLLQQATRANPFALPKTYLIALQHKTKTVESLRQTLKTAVLDEGRKRELTNVIQAHFKEWLLTSGNIRQVYDLARLDRDP
ncbi:unnamed protein product [Closterium sp. Yama58-4]|nr:unnamed protein product [Closterium sp. Yama58-4]